MKKMLAYAFVLGMVFSLPHDLYGYGFSGGSSSTGAPSSSPSSSSSSSPYSSTDRAHALSNAPKTEQRLNVDINALRSKLQERNQSRTTGSQILGRRYAPPPPVDSWEQSSKVTH